MSDAAQSPTKVSKEKVLQVSDLVSNNVITFLAVLFEPSDNVTIRPIETWEEDGRKQSRVLWNLVSTHRTEEWISEKLSSTISEAAARYGNVFLGVCPRQGGNGEYELVWQIGTVRVLWADVDNTTEEEILQRILAAGLPEPTMIVRSGNGVHVYWKLTNAIATEAPDSAVHKHFVNINGSPRALKYMLVDGEKIWLHDLHTGREVKANKPAMTHAAIQVQDVLQGIAVAIGGDQTHDLSRLLRLPGTMNRKNERNGAAPKPCSIVEIDPERRYDFQQFLSFAEKSPARQHRMLLATIPLPCPRQIAPGKSDKLQEKIIRCLTAPMGRRSEADFHLCAWAIEKAVSREEVWLRVQQVGKFAEGGLDYFNRTWVKAEEHVRESMLARSSGSGLSADQELSDEESDNDSTVLISTNEKAVNDSVREKLAKRGDIFDFGGRLVIVVDRNTENGVQKQIKVLCRATVRELATQTCKFLSKQDSAESSSGKQVIARIPLWCCQAIADGGSWPGLPPLFGLVTAPLLRRDGTVLQTTGYDKVSGLYAHFRQPFPEIPDCPTAETVTKAKEDLLDLVVDFPFETERDRSAWLASLLTPLASEAFEGSVGPVFFFDANVRGSGKSRLTNIVSIIVTGHVAAKTSATENEEETRKRITSMVMDGTRMVFLDNLTSLGGPVMDAAITGEIWRDRGLGGNTLIERSLRMTWYATGNNVQLLGDMPRRVCFIRLESPLEMPERRKGFRHPNLLQHVRQHRAGLLTAALTLLRGYIAAGRPNQDLPPWGSFEEWSDLVRSTIVWCGLADPAPPQAACSSTIDEEAQSQQCFLAALRHADFNGTGLRTSQMLEICSSRYSGVSYPYVRELKNAIEAVCDKPLQHVTASLLGAKLRRFKGRVLGGMRLAVRTLNGHSVWSTAGGQGGSGGLSGLSMPQSGEFEEQNENTNISETTGLDQNMSTMSTLSTQLEPHEVQPHPILAINATTDGDGAVVPGNHSEEFNFEVDMSISSATSPPQPGDDDHEQT